MDTQLLPMAPPNTGEVEGIKDVEGNPIVARGMTRWEVMRGKEHGDDPAMLDAYMIACGLDVPLAAAVAWCKAAGALVVDPVTDKIIELTGSPSKAGGEDLGN